MTDKRREVSRTEWRGLGASASFAHAGWTWAQGRGVGFPFAIRGATRVDIMRASGDIECDMPACAWNYARSIDNPILAIRLCAVAAPASVA